MSNENENTPANQVSVSEPDCAAAVGSEDYVPFGEDWRAFVMRLRKEEIVDLLRTSAMNLMGVREKTIEPLRKNLTRLEEALVQIRDFGGTTNGECGVSCNGSWCAEQARRALDAPKRKVSHE